MEEPIDIVQEEDKQKEFFREPNRQASAAVVFMVWDFLRRSLRGLWPLLLVWIFNSGRQSKWEIAGTLVVLVFLPFQLLIGIIGWWRYYFYCQGNELIIEKGVLQRSKSNIPFDRIQTIDFRQSPLHQILNVVGVQIDTAGSSQKEVHIYALDKAKAEALRAFILEAKKGKIATVSETESQENKTLLFSHSVEDLLKTGLSQNHLQTMSIVVAFFFSGLNYIEKILGWKYEEMGSQLFGLDFDSWWLAIGVSLPIFLIVSFVLTLFRTVIRFYGQKVWETEKGFQVVAGLFDRQERSAARNKVQVIQWSINPLQRLFELSTVRIYQAGSGSANKKNKAIGIPGCYPEHLQALVELHVETKLLEGLDRHGISSKVILRRTLFLGILPALVLCAGTFSPLGWQALLWLAWVPICFLLNKRYHKRWYWEINEDILRTHKGIFIDKWALLQLYKVQSVSLHQSPYQYSRELASITLHTAAGGVRIPYISLAKAQALKNYILYRVEKDSRSWM